MSGRARFVEAVEFVIRAIVLLIVCHACISLPAVAQSLEQRLLAEDPGELSASMWLDGDAVRGAVLFYQEYTACRKCHSISDKNFLGPKLVERSDLTDVQIVNAILRPSLEIRKGFESIVVYTTDGRSVTGLLAEQSAAGTTIRDPSRPGKLITIASGDIEELATSPLSMMPVGQVNQLASRQQFLDLARYVSEIARHGLARARELEPPPTLYAAIPLPEYEQRVDHAAMIAGLDDDSFQRGEIIYNRLCVNCHGTQDRIGSLPTSLRFAAGKFKNGADPYTMYQTLTRGFGLMVAQRWMVPQQKYDVIHYVREAYLKDHNPGEYHPVDERYLAGVPGGDTRGPPPREMEPWVTMDYGPSLINTYEAGDDGTNLSYKGIAVRLDTGPGGVSRGAYLVDL